MTVGIIVFSRMSSSRLPGKALIKLGGIPLIERVLKRASICGLPIGLATSNHYSDDVLCEFVHHLGFKVFRGDLSNVLDRGARAAESFGFDYFFRICGDRPVFELDEIRDWKFLLENGRVGDADLITNYTQGLIKGITSELISTKALSRIASLNILSDAQKEHVTSYFYDCPSEFNILYLPSKFNCLTHGSLAIDTLEDLANLANFFSVSHAIDVPTEYAVKFLCLN
ncbi:MAG: hypothetical protein MUE72_09855 [Chitinophagaceae bacterium]|jgi:spore coat polysaccharide biosynthesis protein SpsF|nr:hypothetical protein [Chitinophagaceae bacterium]MCU0383742.1 hypothetical protein [Cyclobacteriaceae bacterium]